MLSFRVFEPGVWAARIVIVLFTLSALLGLVAVIAQTGARFRTRVVFITLFVITFPAPGETNFMLLGRQVLGENPALAFMIAALLLWWRNWESQQLVSDVFCGILLALSLLTKLQVAMPLALVILCVALIRAAKRRAALWRGLVPLATAAGVYLLWTIVTQIGTPEILRSEHRQIMLEGVHIHFLSGLFPAKFDRTITLILVLVALATGFVGWRWLRQLSEMQTPTTQERAENTLALMIALGVIWVAVFSIGWPRYYYSILIFALILIGEFLWQALAAASLRLTRGRAEIAERLTLTGATGCILLFMNLHVLSDIHQALPDYAGQMSAYIDAHVPGEAIIETWEWQVDALSQHRQYHHPHQLMMWEALRQHSRERQFNLKYDLLQANPDYLLLGTFGVWTGIYDMKIVGEQFDWEAGFGPYQLYRRKQQRLLEFIPDGD